MLRLEGPDLTKWEAAVATGRVDSREYLYGYYEGLYCYTCDFWLNGYEQYWNHRRGFKHKTHTRTRWARLFNRLVKTTGKLVKPPVGLCGKQKPSFAVMEHDPQGRAHADRSRSPARSFEREYFNRQISAQQPAVGALLADVASHEDPQGQGPHGDRSRSPARDFEREYRARQQPAIDALLARIASHEDGYCF